MPSGVWPTSITVSGSCWINLKPAGPARIAQARSDGGLDAGRRRFRAASCRSQSRNRVTAMAALLNWNAPGKAHFERAKIVILEPKVETSVPVAETVSPPIPISSRTNRRRDFAIAIIFEEMRPQAPAIFAVDNGAAGGTGVALVGDDQFQRMAEQFDMLVVDRGHAGAERADQAHRIVAAADAGLEHREIALALLKIQAGQREHGLKGAEFFAALPRNLRRWRLRSASQLRQRVIADRRAVDLKPFVEAVQMRRGEQSGSQAIGVGRCRRRTPRCSPCRSSPSRRPTCAASCARSTARASSRSAIRARQTPSPYFGRSNIGVAFGMPDLKQSHAENV